MGFSADIKLVFPLRCEALWHGGVPLVVLLSWCMLSNCRPIKSISWTQAQFLYIDQACILFKLCEIIRHHSYLHLLFSRCI